MSVVLKPKEAAEYLGIGLSTLAQMRMAGKGPVFIAYSPRMIRYRQGDLDAWLEAQPLCTNTAQAMKRSA